MQLQVAGHCGVEMLKLSVLYCQEKMGCNDGLERLKSNHVHALEYFHYGLAMQVGEHLGETSDLVQAVYIYPDTLDENPTLTLPLTLIVQVDNYTAALESIVESLQRNLLEEYRRMFSPYTDKVSSFVHVCLVDKADLVSRKGLAAAVGSVNSPALRAWSRK